MNNRIDPKVQQFLTQGNQGLTRIPPEPKSRVAFDFNSVLTGVRSVAGVATGGGVLGGLDGQYSSLIQTQIDMQEQMQLVSLSSNIEKSRHDSKMAAIRNVRAG